MQRTPRAVQEGSLSSNPQPESKAGSIHSASRRSFVGKLGAASVAASVLGAVPSAIAQSNNSGNVSLGASKPRNPRLAKATNLRIARANADASFGAAPQLANGDEQRYSDHSGSYSKPLLQDDLCLVNEGAWQSFKKALNSGKNSDWEAVIIGGTVTFNGPQGAYAYDLEAMDSVQFGNAPGIGDPNGPVLVPPFDQVTSSLYGTQLIEEYWAAMLRDVAFTDFVNNGTAAAAATELGAQTDYRGPRDSSGNVTPNLLFRGTFQGETLGPHVSQFAITPTKFGQQDMPMLFTTHLPNINYMTDEATFQQVQNGIDTGLRNQLDPVPRFLHDFRGFNALTHLDFPSQEYLYAMLMMFSTAVPINPGCPYNGSRTQNGFCTFGGPDIQQAVAEVASRALIKVWYQKWLVHLTHRPEWGGGLVHLALTNRARQAVPNANVLNSQAVAQTFTQYGTYLLPQTFPEGSPAHPSYPTGHGTAGGACITVLKFFFDGNHLLSNPMVPSSDGLSLQPYTGPDAGQLTVNGELNKLARNISGYGHGVGAGIHWRTDTDNSMLLGEAMALSFLQDRAQCYNEKFTVNITKLDGSIATITNQ